MKWNEIPKFLHANYRVNSTWRYLETHIERFTEEHALELQPDFQRAHVWTDEQASRYVEFRLRGGMSAREVYFNCPGWMTHWRGPMQLVDGLQRITAVRRFLAGEVRAFGQTIDQFGPLNHLPLECDFIFAVNNLETRAEVLQWYIDLNAGGVIHTEEEIRRVREMLAREQREG